MASNSLIAGVQELYDTLTAANFPGSTRPSIYFDQGPQYDGQQVRPPYVIIRDGGISSNHTFESDPIEGGDITLYVYADTLAHVDQIVKAIRWNGQTPRTRAGFDFGTVSLNSPLSFFHLVHKNEQRSIAGIGVNGQRTHMATVVYEAAQTVLGGATP